MKKNQKLTIEIGFGTIFWVLFSIIALRFLGSIIDIFILLFIAVLIAMALSPLVDSLEKRKINRNVSSLIILLSIFVVLILSVVSIIVPLIQQTESFIERLPDIAQKVYPYFHFDISQLDGNTLSFVPGQVYRIAVGTFSSLVSLLTLLVISYYIIREIHNLPKYLEYWFGKEKGSKIAGIIGGLEVQIGYWVRGELSLMIIVGALSYFGYLLVGLPYTIALGVIAGLLELVPNIGPTIATIPAALVGFSISPTHGIAAIIVQLVVQQLENNFIVPKVMQKSIGLNPLVTIVGLMVGYRIGGALVAVIALPLILSARVILSHIRLNKDTNIPEIS